MGLSVGKLEVEDRGLVGWVCAVCMRRVLLVISYPVDRNSISHRRVVYPCDFFTHCEICSISSPQSYLDGCLDCLLIALPLNA